MPQLKTQLPSTQTTSPSKFESSFNVRDEFKGLSLEEIKSQLRDSCFPAEVCMVNISGDFNFGSVIRNANAFGFCKVHHVAPQKQWDRRGAVGAHHYTDLEHWKSFDELYEREKDNFSFVALENNVAYVDKMWALEDQKWPEKTMLVVGSEGEGLSDNILDRVSNIVFIRQYGSIRSINVACASAVAMHSYCEQWSK